MSNKTMTITDIAKSPKSFKDTHTLSVGGFGKSKQAPEWFLEFKKENDERWARQEQFNQKQLEFNQFVIDQFKKHGWAK